MTNWKSPDSQWGTKYLKLVMESWLNEFNFYLMPKYGAYSAQNMKTHGGYRSQTNRIQIYVMKIYKAQRFN